MKNGMAMASGVLSVLVMVMAGCAGSVAEEANDEGRVARTASAITSMGYFTATSNFAFDGPPVDLGPDSDRTCFLQGVRGELKGAQFGTPGKVSVYQANGRWLLKTWAGGGLSLQGYATCIPTTFRRQFMGWSAHSCSFDNCPTKNWLAKENVTVGTQCMLTEVRGTVGWEMPSANVTLRKEHIYWGGEDWDTWTLGGNLIHEQDGGEGGGGRAVCVDMLATSPTFALQAPAGSTGTTTTLQPQSTHACGLTRLIGHFAQPDDLTDGARVFPDGSWKAWASDGKGIEGRCYGRVNL